MVLQNRLSKAFVMFGEWKRANQIVSTQARFTCSRLGRHARNDFPSLQSKGIAGKRVSFWLADLCMEYASRPEATELDQLVATTMSCYRDFLKLISEFPLKLTRRQAMQIFKAGHLHLLTYARLRQRSANTEGAHTPNRCLWQLAPKHHYFFHLLHTIKQTRVNCRYFTLLAGEGFVGIISRAARLCHRSNVTKRVIQRYRMKMSMDIRRRFGLNR